MRASPGKNLALRSTAPVALLVVGLSVGLLFIATTQGLSALLTFAVLLLIPFAVFVLPSAVRQAVASLRELATNLQWWHGLWLLVFLSGLVFRVRDTQTIRETPLDAWAAYRILLVGTVAGVLLVRLSLRQTEWLPSMFRGLVGALAVFALISLASTTWSPYPTWTLYKALEYLVDVALLAAVLAVVRSTREYKTLLDWTLAIVGFLLLTVWAGALLWPEQAFVRGSELLPGRISGVVPAIDQNGVGEYAALLGIIAVTRLTSALRENRSRIFYWVLLGLALITLLLSQTRVAIVGFLVAAALVLMLARRLGVLVMLSILLVLLLAFTQFGGLLAQLWQREEAPETLESFSGRVTLWEASWGRFLERPLIGYGAYAGGRFLVLASVGSPNLSSSLSSYVEVMIGTGLLGLVSIVAALAGTWWQLLRSLASSALQPLQRQLVLESLGTLTIVTARSFFTVEMIWHPALIFFAVLGYAEFLRRTPKSFECLGEA